MTWNIPGKTKGVFPKKNKEKTNSNPKQTNTKRGWWNTPKTPQKNLKNPPNKHKTPKESLIVGLFSSFPKNTNTSNP